MLFSEPSLWRVEEKIRHTWPEFTSAVTLDSVTDEEYKGDHPSSRLESWRCSSSCGGGFAGDSPADDFAIATLKTVLLGKLPLEAKAAAAVATELGYTALHQHNNVAAPKTRSPRLDQAIRHFRKAVSFSHTDRLSEAYTLKTLAERP